MQEYPISLQRLFGQGGNSCSLSPPVHAEEKFRCQIKVLGCINTTCFSCDVLFSENLLWRIQAICYSVSGQMLMYLFLMESSGEALRIIHPELWEILGKFVFFQNSFEYSCSCRHWINLLKNFWLRTIQHYQMVKLFLACFISGCKKNIVY